MWVYRLPLEQVDGFEVGVGYLVQEDFHVCSVSFETICSVTSNSNFVVAAELETIGFLRDLSELPETVLLRSSVVLDGGGELGDLGGESGHGGGQDCIEFAEVGKMA